MVGMIVLVVMFTIAGCCCYIIGENRAMYRMYKYTIEIMESFEVEDVPIDFAKGVLYGVEELYYKFDINGKEKIKYAYRIRFRGKCK